MKATAGARRAAAGLWLLLLGLGALTLPACAAENRTGPEAAAALTNGAMRDYAVEQATQVGHAALLLADAVAGSAPDVAAAQAAWSTARAAYDRGAPIFLAAAPELDFLLDGRFDSPLARTGLRQMERAVFGKPPGTVEELRFFAATYLDAAKRLPGQVGDGGRVLSASAVIGNLSAVCAVAATKLDGSDSPYAGQSHRSIENNLVGLQALYAPLSPLVQAADPELDRRTSELFAALLAQIRGVSSVDEVTDKVGFLRRIADLSQALLSVGTAVGLSATAPVDVT